jgi:ribosomal protein S18 acetylase RimI-like enzyme
MGIDVSLMWGTIDPSGRYFHQVCLAVIGAGRTAMLFMSDDEAVDWDFGLGNVRQRDDVSGIAQREVIVQHVCRHLASLRGPINGRSGQRAKGSTRVLAPGERSVILVQGLLEEDEQDAAEALSRAGFMQLGELVYMRRPLAGASSRRAAKAEPLKWPAGVTVRRMSEMDDRAGHAKLARALSRSYIDTLDCPELCGLREIEDVIDSHRAVGELNLATWWLVEENGEAEGAMLLSECAEQRTVELVYLGLSPTMRGRGLGVSLLKMGLSEVSGAAATTMTCAVDSRNTPAMKLYKRAGFQRFSIRVPMVRGIGEGRKC